MGLGFVSCFYAAPVTVDSLIITVESKEQTTALGIAKCNNKLNQVGQL